MERHHIQVSELHAWSLWAPKVGGAASRPVCMSGAYNTLAVNALQGCVHARTQGHAADDVTHVNT